MLKIINKKYKQKIKKYKIKTTKFKFNIKITKKSQNNKKITSNKRYPFARKWSKKKNNTGNKYYGKTVCINYFNQNPKNL